MTVVAKCDLISFVDECQKICKSKITNVRNFDEAANLALNISDKSKFFDTLECVFEFDKYDLCCNSWSKKLLPVKRIKKNEYYVGWIVLEVIKLAIKEKDDMLKTYLNAFILDSDGCSGVSSINDGNIKLRLESYSSYKGSDKLDVDYLYINRMSDNFKKTFVGSEVYTTLKVRG